eukprot:TRINITY_DN1849_c0_g1_i4.p1 TRINITY_DN1849_c0_g1~~TRINITY_DN1849_c0_g1_i4.p1  ORF type:complete len:282 (+),score=59.00 TRINITY_DN1849_c0_g1_i4:61-846(+)
MCIRDRNNMLTHLGTQIKRFTDKIKVQEYNSESEIPRSFDSRRKWPKCIGEVQLQPLTRCGSGWVTAAAEVLADRLCIAQVKKGIFKRRWSPPPQRTHFCSGLAADLCAGVSLEEGWLQIKRIGLEVEDTCPVSETGDIECEEKCPPSKDDRRVKVRRIRTFKSSDDAKREIMQYGPLEAAVEVYSEFLAYSQGIYKPSVSYYYLGGHSVRIIGWGEENGLKYWIIANNWGDQWGEKGYGRIEEGSTSIERQFIGAIPYEE